MIYAISCLSMKRHSAIFTFPSLAKLAVSLRAWTQLSILRNATPTDVISQYDYTYDAAGRRIEIARSGTAMSESRTDAYGYNVRNELTSATKTGGPASPEYAYQYDDIGNRITSTDLTTNRTYTANSLNQYSAITTSDSGLQTSSFTPQFDDDGNQTLIQTSTGIWSVQYNGENRPVLWTGGTQSAATNIVMSFDRMGRRVEYEKAYSKFEETINEAIRKLEQCCDKAALRNNIICGLVKDSTRDIPIVLTIYVKGATIRNFANGSGGGAPYIEYREGYDLDRGQLQQPFSYQDAKGEWHKESLETLIFHELTHYYYLYAKKEQVKELAPLSNEEAKLFGTIDEREAVFQENELRKCCPGLRDSVLRYAHKKQEK